jgi:2-methylcitrate dehydratase PrpD
MPRISVSLDPECEAVFPARRSAKVTIRLRGGKELFQHQPTRKGDPDAPLSDRELDEKFLELAEPVVGDAAAKALLAQLWNGTSLPGLVPLLPA